MLEIPSLTAAVDALAAHPLETLLVVAGAALAYIFRGAIASVFADKDKDDARLDQAWQADRNRLTQADLDRQQELSDLRKRAELAEQRFIDVNDKHIATVQTLQPLVVESKNAMVEMTMVAKGMMEVAKTTNAILGDVKEIMSDVKKQLKDGDDRMQAVLKKNQKQLFQSANNRPGPSRSMLQRLKGR